MKKTVHCEQCGSIWEHGLEDCAKCGWDLRLLNRSKTWTYDIAHQQETVAEAVDKMYATLDYGIHKKYGKVKLIVGSGKIRVEIEKILSHLKFSKKIKFYTCQNKNPGAYIVVL
jgi:predicted  nucleic acid-binding Zn-ribbon protein|tara:strand:- start:227 stop:568 length:342 start_codon:yes stop_codon:yes gene_type:complete